MDDHISWLHDHRKAEPHMSRLHVGLLCQLPVDSSSISQYNSLCPKDEIYRDSDLDINVLKDHSRVNKLRKVFKPATKDSHRLQRFRYSYSTCPGHVIVCIKGTYSLLAFKCFFCLRSALGVIYQCEKCGTYICGSCKESERKFKWTRGKDPDYFGQ